MSLVDLSYKRNEKRSFHEYSRTVTITQYTPAYALARLTEMIVNLDENNDDYYQATVEWLGIDKKLKNKPNAEA
ncbi:hypothetical protein AYR62_11115 [Secundilactobacillus paracollinoides]|uniref:Uncharacterized protein n=1 Tax=Secundilactobacillus paracollinoides TaxID=240427 RepID=A0A1B2IXZ9_9LACO|nr:hypothetical protein AYR62_11115 [Secundilactobacillus paracollinoides]ANZ66917.1 hypothetical protein AYR63_07090 [Secundilactobacillus paracollinoides]